MQTFLIVGGSKEERLKKAEETVGQKLTSLKNNPDFSFLQLVENSIGISEIRDLQKKLVLKPFQEEQKTVLIHEAQNLTPEAQNALLKTLEEPPLLSKIILTVPETSWLLPTIVSRCQIIRLPSLGLRIDNEDSQKILSIFNLLTAASLPERLKIIEEEKIATDRETATTWLDSLTSVLRKEVLLGRHLSSFPNIISSISKTKNYLKANGNVRLGLEVFVIDLPRTN